ncbi:hypothetical protein [Alicyclobacillus acidocaldarius]|uniref:Uncharacterized protein n=1 Tax=Alicyclobacillus acidocaldarius subsp. acidocaldarius (strain ATCC 27009 / DSM 446 / BCRC 14685 / JCM 5260 / KCTC 1825 / NBRC 15652 / NCIMB 11725 / NRRL B-14509 / 104-IA) TaxID=521098 RepID=C8WX92_ALIAD|nr:hypothetical protein [Alicyclobacillus acidocaldarius]ACV58714.1 hypothetical protein Aaci_1702 [Alicyclobacillus acidocaldarius subsp. acidocaldarius DSM 446]
MQHALIWIVPAAIWLSLWPPSSIAPRWVVRAAIVGCLTAWLFRWLIPEWVPPTVWLAVSAYEIVGMSRVRWTRAGGAALAAIAAMVVWPRMAPFADWGGIPPEVWAAAMVGAAASILSPAPATRALASVGLVLAGWVLGRDALQMATVFVFAAAFELWRTLAGARGWRGSGEEAGH